jgi:hypothetical protein
MILVLAVLLLQIPAIPQTSSSVPRRASADVTQAGGGSAGMMPSADATPLPSDRLTAEKPRSSSEVSAPGDFCSVSNPPTEKIACEPVALSKSNLPSRSEKTRHRKWLVLTVAQHGAATFDAWSTRRVISRGEAQELNPMLRPFAGNASIYAAVQVAPVLFDYLGRRMMTSPHGWARRTWWILQTVSTATSLVSGAHNLSIR